MIKLGQVFSSRTDLLHPAYCEALVQLQTAVPSVSGPRVRTLLEEELGSPLPFDSFDETPIAGASLGQVHRAVYNGKQVAVKIQRAQLQQLFDTDFRNIRMGCRMMNGMERVRERVRRWRGRARARPIAIGCNTLRTLHGFSTWRSTTSTRARMRRRSPNR